MKVKLWKVHLQNQNTRYWGERDDVTVQAPNAKCAIDRAITRTFFKANINSVESVELLGVAEN
ncbi:MAG: hypothetical protein ACREAK_08175 [Nitrosarchaeum sp.]